jgi:pyruvate dehydrogenase E2 component (dihydrolipoamide acetyltransferase)
MTTMIQEFKLPDLGEGLTESEIVSWHVAVGDTVELNQVIGEVETAKAVVELPSPYAGTVTAITHEPGTTVEVGEVIIAFEVAATAAAGSEPVSEPAQKRVPTLVGYGADPESSKRPARRARQFAPSGSTTTTTTVPAATAVPAATTVPAAASRVAGLDAEARVQADRPRSTPPVRKLARDMGIDLAGLVGSGERGLITRDDVVAYAGGHAQGAAATAAAPASSASRAGVPTGSGNAAREVRTPIKGVRKFTAAAMVQSAFTAPHVTEFLTVDVTAGMEFLAKLRGLREFADVKLTPLTLAARAVCLGIARQPSLNSRWDAEANEIVTMNYVNLGIAAATPRGLVVPNIKDAQQLGMRGLAVALGELAAVARSGKTPPADLSGGTFSITNIGVFGIDAGTPILNPGEAGILALGAVRSTPWEHQGGIALRQVMTLSLSFDHRLVDGEQGSRFLADVGAVMSDPAMALALA